MPKFKFELPAPIDSANAFSKIKGFLSGDNSFKKFDPNLSCTFDEPSKTCAVKGGQFNAILQVQSNNTKSSQVAIEVEVPLALALFKGKIQEELEKSLKKILS